MMGSLFNGEKHLPLTNPERIMYVQAVQDPGCGRQQTAKKCSMEYGVQIGIFLI
jgi:hypothetical protein